MQQKPDLLQKTATGGAQLRMEPPYDTATQGAAESWRGVVPVFGFVMVALVMLMALTGWQRGDHAQAGLVFGPGISQENILGQVAAGGGRVVRFGGFGHLAVVVRDDGAAVHAGDFGALFAVTPLIVSVCGASS